MHSRNSIERCFLLWLVIFDTISYVILCKHGGYTVIEDKVVTGTKIVCSPRIERITGHIRLIELLSQDYVIAIYKRNETAAQLCYWKEIENGLLELASLSGGKIHTIGRSN